MQKTLCAGAEARGKNECIEASRIPIGEFHLGLAQRTYRAKYFDVPSAHQIDRPNVDERDPSRPLNLCNGSAVGFAKAEPRKIPKRKSQQRCR